MTPISRFDYLVNANGQRTGVTTTGSAFPSQPADWTWGYDALGQVTSADSPTNTFDRAYEYDQIGNRKKSADGELVTTGSSVIAYDPNPLNQYSQISVPSVSSVVPIHDQDGNATSYLLPVAPTTNATLVHEGENRLISVTTGTTIVAYAYDSQSRRVARTESPLPLGEGQGEGAQHTIYLYDAWNCLAEYTLHNSSFNLHTFHSWGLDISGSLQGAGGVGGFLAVSKHQAQSTTLCYPTYDGNGNVSEYLDATSSIAAHYEYDPVGRAIVVNGTNASEFAYRFSTKPVDSATGLYYYGFRWFDPYAGRWPSRDPIEESGGVNLYAMSENDLVTQIDLIGLSGGGAGHGYTIIGPAREWTFDFGKALGKTKDFQAKVPVGLVGSGDVAMRINGFYGSGTKTPICCSEGYKAKTSEIFEGKVHASVGFEVGYTVGWFQPFDFSIVRGRLLFGVRGFFKGSISGGGSVVYDGCKDEMRWGISASGLIAGGLEGAVGVYHQWRSIFGGYGDESFFGATVFAEGGLTGDVFFRCSGKQCESGGGVNPYATVGWRVGLGGPFTLEDSKTIHGDPLPVGPFYYQNPFGEGDI